MCVSAGTIHGKVFASLDTYRQHRRIRVDPTVLRAGGEAPGDACLLGGSHARAGGDVASHEREDCFGAGSVA